MNTEEVTIWTLDLNTRATQATYPPTTRSLNPPMQSADPIPSHHP